MNKLTNRQRVFVELYLTLWNATEAARQAGYSEKTANQQGPRLLVNVGIQKAIEARIAEKTATAEEVLMRLTAHARGNMDDFLSPMGMIDIEQARERGVMPLVKKIKQHTTRISKSEGEDVEYHDIELELYDAQAATVQLGRARGVFASEAPQVTVNNNLSKIEIVYVNQDSPAASDPGDVARLALGPGADQAGT